ncbi:hypothetical protein EGA29_19765 [Ralstonia pseudosolanacearum]|uniref:Uncharacterized protein n=1 Tax=Ralstonia pseudosolanacearum TaxID=1310165 RepID=A0A454TLL5_9RALS|nr:hypothetical protein EGA29_19765 [Ralstonia pseudosolanacearum]
MRQVYEVSDQTKRWWDLVWFLPAAPEQPEGQEWAELCSHPCGGMSCNYLDGWVLPVGGAPACQDMLRDIVDEVWCTEHLGLDYGVSDSAKAEYAGYLAGKGMEPGELGMLQQGVYPLSATDRVLDTLGIGESPASGALLMVLGPNCD